MLLPLRAAMPFFTLRAWEMGGSPHGKMIFNVAEPNLGIAWLGLALQRCFSPLEHGKWPIRLMER
jgi:hypothetical protein